MHLIERIFSVLLKHELVESAEDFSVGWCKRSKSWYAERKHSGRDFSVPTAIDCLEAANIKLTVYKLSRRRIGGLLDVEIRVLEEVTEALRVWLDEQHRITEVRLQGMPAGEML